MHDNLIPPIVTSQPQQQTKKIQPHAKIPHADMDWVMPQSPTVMRLFMESWRCDSFGSMTKKGKPQWHELKTTLQGSNLRKAMKVLVDAQLFQYEPIFEKAASGQYKIIGWKCWNKHGYYHQREQQKKALAKGGYQKFLASEYWQQVREVVIQRDRCCQLCGSTNPLQVHHLSYEHYRDEMNHLEDLITLCNECHAFEHEIISSSTTN
jgi:hypothetical protein